MSSPYPPPPNPGWTRHGHPIPGVPSVGTPAAVARCGGPAICAQCAADVDRAQLVDRIGREAEERYSDVLDKLADL